MPWQTETHSGYRENRWELVRAHLSGDILDRLDDYLIRKKQGEADEAYEVRQDIASYIPHFMRAVLGLVGMILQNEPDAEREWWAEDTPLGSPTEEGTTMARIWENVDGDGMNWGVMVSQVLTLMTGYQQAWGIVEGIDRRTEEGEMPTMADASSNGRIRALNPLSVIDWTSDDSGRLVEVQVRSSRSMRTSVKKPDQERRQVHVYGLEGVEVWLETGDDADDPWMRDETFSYGPNGFQYEGRDGRPILPIWRTTVPTHSPVGYMMAKYASWLFNFRNVRNFHMWTSALARGYTDATDEEGRFDKDLWDKFKELLEEGSAFYPKEIGYAAPPMDGADTRNDIYEQERDDFYEVFFQSYGDAAKEKTATEIRQDVAQGVAAYLTLQSSAMDEWENAALWRLAQVHMPGRSPEMWGQASVSRDRDFTHLNVEKQLKELREGAFGGDRVPIGTQGRVEAAKKYAGLQGLSVLESEVEAEVQRGSGTGGIASRLGRLEDRALGETPPEEERPGSL